MSTMAKLPPSIKEASRLLKSGHIGEGDLIEGCLGRIQNHAHLNAFTFVKGRKALRPPSSRSKVNPSDKGPREGLKLGGIPMGVKDNFCVASMPTTCGSKMLHPFVPPYTATVVKRLEEAGAVVVAKTNMDEFGMGNGTVDSIFGPTKNIWGLQKFAVKAEEESKAQKEENGTKLKTFEDWHVPGGSSGGSAVSVAAGICMAALGSDTGGSVRNPASYCGVYGFKPTYGSVSRHGLIPLVNSMDVPGIISRNVEDCALIYDIIKGRDELDSTTVNFPDSSTVPSEEGTVKGVKIGIPKEYSPPGLSPEVSETWKQISDLLEKEGALVSQVSLPHTKYSISCYSVLNPCEVASNMSRYDGLRYGHRSNKPGLNSTESLYAQTRHEGFNSVVRGRILAGNYFLLKANYDKYFLQALKVRRLIAQDFDNVWGSVQGQNFQNEGQGQQLLLTPVTLTTAPTYTKFMEWDNRTQSSVQDYCTQSANMAGLPALSIPIKLSEDRLPISLQLIGPRFSEGLIFEVAKRIENLVNFKHFTDTDYR